MTFTFSKRWLFLPGAILLLIGGLLAYFLENAAVSYPLDVWRMDLDDTLANIGLFLAGLGGFVAVFVKADRAHKKADAVSVSINGGLADLAEQHVAVATQEAQEAGHYVELLGRVTKIEKQRDDCHEELAVVRVEMGKIQDWVVKRLDDSGNGRNTVRE